ncbi:hypothetical protein A9Q86_02235 [Flavobacteriales bacterium 33_180_T64]|nr:hypothetical protein A9Q86_02235 [Flavobacteriales bacterium 33_180_T64]
MKLKSQRSDVRKKQFFRTKTRRERASLPFDNGSLFDSFWRDKKHPYRLETENSIQWANRNETIENA